MDNLFKDNGISKIGVGTWQMGLKGWGKDYDEKSVIDAFLFAVNNGINFVDTAEIYGGGKSEILIGKALEKVNRKNVFIATKVAGFNATSSKIGKSLEGSLKRMKVDYIDLYQIHWEPSIYTNLEDLFQSAEKLVKEGLIKHLGVSNFSLKTLIKVSNFLKDTRIESNQVKFNLIERPENELLTYMNENSIKLIAWSPLGQGFLSGKYSINNKPPGMIRRVNTLFSNRNLARFDPLLSVLKGIATKRKISVTQVVLSFEASMNVLPIPGFKNLEQAKEISNSLKISLTDDEISRITRSINETGIIRVNGVMFPTYIPNSVVRIMSLFI